jgi:predicted enzyme related to lactoylglutathione lyase
MLGNHPIHPVLLATDLAAAKDFYHAGLGLQIQTESQAAITFACGGGTQLTVTKSTTGTADSQTQASWSVTDLRAEVDELRSRGVTVEDYDLPGVKTDDGIADIGFAWAAWIIDPGNNALGILQVKQRPTGAAADAGQRADRGGSDGPDPTPRETLWALSTAGFPARCLHAAADLGIADRIDDLPVPVHHLAAAADVDSDALDRVLRLLAAHGVFHQHTGGFGHSPASRLLRSDHPMSMLPFVAMAAMPMMWGSLTELKRSVRTGRPALEALEPDGLWAYLRDRPDEAAVFARAMTAKASGEIAAVLASYDFSGFATIADIGGGRGHLLQAVLDATPSATGILFDLPEVVDNLDVSHPRMTATAGNFFVDALPAADAYLLMDVLHDWPDHDCVAILRAVRRAAPSHATVLILEGIVAHEAADPGSATLDVVMLALTGGRERSPDQLDTLLGRAGFSLDNVIDTPSPIRIAQSHAI